MWNRDEYYIIIIVNHSIVMMVCVSTAHVGTLCSGPSTRRRIGSRGGRETLTRSRIPGNVCASKVEEDRETSADKPEWTGDSVVSKIVNAMISSPVIFGLMKVGARQQFKMTAEKNGIPWGGVVESLQSSREMLEALYRQVNDDSIVYPEYYTQPFHAYDEGNLNWLAAYEVEPATYSMAMRVWKNEEGLHPKAAQERLRGNAFEQVRHYLGDVKVESMLDVGCSSGVSTRYLANAFPEASEVVGLDLSPYFLSVAMLRKHSNNAIFEEDMASDGIRYVHGNAEYMAGSLFPEESFDVVSCQFVLHELPPEPTRKIMEECMKILKPGGVLFLVDNDPKSDVIQNLPPAIFTLMKSTEPHSDEYYAWDQERCLQHAGFVDIQTSPCDPRHRLIMARKPT